MNIFKCVTVWLIDWLIDWFSFLRSYIGAQISKKTTVEDRPVGRKQGSTVHVCPRETGFENYQKWRMDSWISSTVQYILFIEFFLNFLFIFNFSFLHDSHGSLARTLGRPLPMTFFGVWTILTTQNKSGAKHF